MVACDGCGESVAVSQGRKDKAGSSFYCDWCWDAFDDAAYGDYDKYDEACTAKPAAKVAAKAAAAKAGPKAAPKPGGCGRGGGALPPGGCPGAGGGGAAPSGRGGRGAGRGTHGHAAELQARAERQQAIAKAQRLREMKRMANVDPPVLLSRRMRDRLRAALGLPLDMQELALGDLPQDITDEEAISIGRLVEMGFTSAAAEAAVAACREEGPPLGHPWTAAALTEHLRVWLCLNLPEEELPAGFSAKSGQIGVNTGPGSSAAPEESAAGLRAEFLGKARSALLGALGGDSGAAEALLCTVELLLPPEDEPGAEPQEGALAEVLEAEGASGACAAIRGAWADLLASRARLPPAGAPTRAAQACAAEAAGAAPVADEAVEDEPAFGEGAGLACADDEGPAAPGRGAAGKASGRSGGRGGSRGGGPWFGPAGAEAPAARESAQRHAEWLASAAGRAMQKVREDLPAARSRKELLALLGAPAAEQLGGGGGRGGRGRGGQRGGEGAGGGDFCRLVMVQGETGCGKTTQVGQFLVEAVPGARVVVTQPRRVAAASVAQRVADERGERLGEGAVGFKVRGESKMSGQKCQLLFCTLGVLLRRLTLGDRSAGAGLLGPDVCTHLVVDEVHERSSEVDLLLTLLRLRMPEFPQLRVVLMSATMDLSALTRMFPGAPSISIPGRTFPVQDFYLDEVARMLGEEEGPERGEKRDAVDHAAGRLGPLDFGLIARLVVALARGRLEAPRGSAPFPAQGAVLVFLPGAGEIARLVGELERAGGASGGAPALLRPLPLHGGLTTERQRACFEVLPPGGPRKVVCATNVAETSITIPDVTAVVDTCRERRLRLEAGSFTPCLAEQLCAQDALRQRMGRAGRVQAGVCFRLVKKKAYDQLPRATPPEIESLPLESLVLTVRHMGFEPRAFLSQAPTPPKPESVVVAEQALDSLGAIALDEGGAVKALGQHLARLPCDVRIGKLLILGAVLGCHRHAAALAGVLSVRSPLLRGDEDSDRRRKELRSGLRPGGGRSDHCMLAQLAAAHADAGGYSQRRELCARYGLSSERMQEAASVSGQLLGELSALGFCRPGEGIAGLSGAPALGSPWRLLRAATCAAFYPMVARIERPAPTYVAGLSGTTQAADKAKDLRYFVQEASAGARTGSEGGVSTLRTRAFLHPSSGLFLESSFGVPYVVFSAKQVQQQRSELHPTKLVLSVASECSIFALLLFGGRLTADHRAGTLALDGWVRARAGSSAVAALVERLRRELEALLRAKVEDPRAEVRRHPVARVLVELLETAHDNLSVLAFYGCVSSAAAVASGALVFGELQDMRFNEHALFVFLGVAHCWGMHSLGRYGGERYTRLDGGEKEDRAEALSGRALGKSVQMAELPSHRAAADGAAGAPAKAKEAPLLQFSDEPVVHTPEDDEQFEDKLFAQALGACDLPTPVDGGGPEGWAADWGGAAPEGGAAGPRLAALAPAGGPAAFDADFEEMMKRFEEEDKAFAGTLPVLDFDSGQDPRRRRPTWSRPGSPRSRRS
ncbi:unnamed protein product [Prorocentrum cordatum]|uniref:RNA helicase n=1 Tax=Prorocentrum cordatum TaxID=2364126 RepID=A0ABN9VSU1_9DINO|nr:unnamed protein product [Polarella glacialis]